ncbi:MAG: valine--tRNA ligase [Thermotogae bacterium]|nr:valine--tRNA ligase [Thermotogota bacterium]
MDKTYNYREWEKKLYEKWLKHKLFRATAYGAKRSGKPTFTIMMPPPNVTGDIHLGHVLDNTIQDVVARYKRMAGFYVLWQPGTDHAGIATQNVVEKELAKEGKSRFDVGREEFLRRVWAWKEKYGGRILEALKRLGVSPDWERTRFTMDEDYTLAVKTAFVKLYRAGLIYRGKRLINWCPRCGTALADDEVEREEEQGKIYYLRYPLANGGGYVVVATTRPETYLGDTAVAVNPEDERYKHLIGKKVRLPFVGERRDIDNNPVGAEIPVIADPVVDLEFGTGAVKVTPAHDFNDWEIGERHDLPKVQVIDFNAKMNKNAGRWAGLDRFEAREKIVKAFAEAGLLEKIEDHSYAPGRCYRCKTVIEPLPSLQWFVKMKPLAYPALKVWERGQLKIVPEMFGKIYRNWLANVRDWCISRQIWWGHRIPVWYGPDGKEFVADDEEEARQQAKEYYGRDVELKQDEDVLDTWFSSWLWPFATLGWPKETEDLKVFYPTQFLQSGWDILFFWDARMVMAGLFFTGEVPFEVLYLHGLLRDKYGRKLSKSLKNYREVFELLDDYGADGLRYGVLSLTPEGRDIRFDEKALEVGRNFANKIWNATRLLVLSSEGVDIDLRFKPEKLYQKWALHTLKLYTKRITDALESYRFDEYAHLIYHLIWSNLADWFLESLKPDLKAKDENAIDLAYYVWLNALKLAHPLMPFITDAAYEKMPIPEKAPSLMSMEWPEVPYDFPTEYDEYEALKEAVREFRAVRDIIGLKRAPYRGKVDPIFEVLAGAESREAEIWVRLPSKVEVYIGLSEEQKDKVISRLKKEIDQLEKVIGRIEKKLASDFVKKAPAPVVEAERRKYKELKGKLATLRRQLEAME